MEGSEQLERGRARVERRGSTARSWVRRALLALIGAGCGASALAEAYYDIPVWGAIAVALLAVLLGLAIGHPARPAGPAAVALGALALLWLWALLSQGWAGSDDQALALAGQFALYAALLAVLLLLLRRRGDYWALLPLLMVGVTATALWVTLEMLGPDGPSLFVGGRLVEPLGYVNGQAGFFLVGLWPLIALAEQTRYPLLAGLGIAAAFIVACMLVLGQARGVLPGTVVSAVVVLAVVPGRPRRLTVLLLVGAAVALVSRPVLDVYSEAPGLSEAVDKEIVQDAGRAILLGAVILGVAWAGAQALLSGLGSRASGARRITPAVEGAVGLTIVVLAAGVALAAVDDPLGKVDEQYDEFVNLRTEQTGDTRFFSGGGYRYDYWRIAWQQFRDHPVRGVGAGNYELTYFRERRTNEDIRQPHSLELQTLAELGLVGGLALVAFIGAVLAGFWRASRRAGGDRGVRVIAVAAGGAFVAWLVHTSVDWLHLLPGVTGIALCGAAMLLAPWMRQVPRNWNRLRILGTAGVAVVILLAALTVGRFAAAERFRLEGRDKVASDPVEALRLANESLALNGDSLPAIYLKSAAYARLGIYRKSRGALVEARRKEPHDWLPWALLGDLEVRRGRIAQARRNYRRALRLNPRHDRLEQLVKNPQLALESGPG